MSMSRCTSLLINAGENGRFYTRGRIIFLDELGKHSLFVLLCVSSIKTGTKRIIRLDVLSSAVRRSRRTMKDISFRRIMRLVPVFILEMHDQTEEQRMFVQVRPDA